MINDRGVLVPGVDGFRASPSSYFGTAAPGGAAGGPAGSGSMLFFALIYLDRLNTSSGTIFSRTNRANGGWEIFGSSGSSGGQISVRAFNATPASVSLVTAGGPLTLEGQNVPYLIIGSYQQDGVNPNFARMSGWMNGVSMGTPVSLGAGYTSYAGPTCVGVRASTSSEYWIYGPIGDCGLLDGYDVGTYVDPIFGNGGPGLSARWLADLREGRYLTWPRAGVVNSDWYWSARDVVAGLGTLPTWTDRFTGTVMNKGGQPQGASFMPRPR